MRGRPRPGLGDDAVWGRLLDGVSPAPHARFFYLTFDPSSYETSYKDRSWLKREPFWSTIARNGREVAVVDVPSAASQRAGRAASADWHCHGRSGLPAANLSDLVGEMIARFGDDATDGDRGPDRRCDNHALAAGEIEPFLAELERSIERKCAASEWLLARGRWDLFLTVFKESHCAGHLCWSASAEAQEPLRRIYRALDSAIGRLVERVSAATPVVVFSNLGMAANHSGDHLLDAVLEKLEPHVAPRRTVLRRLLERFEQGGALNERPRARRASGVYRRAQRGEQCGARERQGPRAARDDPSRSRAR